MIPFSSQAEYVLRTLNEAGHSAYLVGGCVRDALLGIDPKDCDITTSALPEETEALFPCEKVLETGMKHGTVTVLVGHVPIEVTTFRTDQPYLDHRHPSSVTFTSSLEEDLSRRDFTINALAFRPAEGIVDLFGGEKDLRDGIVRCVGDPDARFREDALRILRALRFSSRFGFSVEEKTDAAIRRNASLLNAISAERIASELNGILCGRHAGAVLLKYADVLAVPIPELLPLKGFDQRNPHHLYDVLEHTARTVDAVPPEKDLRLAALFHDIGKPDCYTEDAFRIGHFYGHPQVSARIAAGILRRLKYDNRTRDTVVTLVRNHDINTGEREKTVRRWMSRLSPEMFSKLILLQRADSLAQNPDLATGQDVYDRIDALKEKILAEGQCLSLRDLAVSGSDLIAAGVPAGPEVGRRLEKLLDLVLDEKLPNEKTALISYGKEHWN